MSYLNIQYLIEKLSGAFHVAINKSKINHMK